MITEKLEKILKDFLTLFEELTGGTVNFDVSSETHLDIAPFSKLM